MGRTVFLTFCGFGLLRGYFKSCRTSPQKNVHNVEGTFVAGHVQKSKLDKDLVEAKFSLKNH